MAKNNIKSEVWANRARVLKALANQGISSIPCPRCDGQGSVDREDWITTGSNGEKECFRCHGSGEVRNPVQEPLRVRYAVWNSLKPLIRSGDLTSILVLERKDKDSVYFPILADVYTKAIDLAEKKAGA